ncbi:DNA-binding protein [Agrobacterium tumefaciens]|uniref:DNA-binding protein n=1 Tax=Agrobacterium tumefaciens TaxID=358 RepID=UPI000DD9E661|nr:DNA-binding protein [Agrobacterium tumefaciens]UXS09219.1 DNA-binding protein [Agrobacterium tumefaciens]UXS16578.1 DNA-binding protein [Agrobacterium tumefaciens]
MATETGKLDLVWGVAEIAKVILRNERQTAYMLKKNYLPARKVGGAWVAERAKLVSFLLGTE